MRNILLCVSLVAVFYSGCSRDPVAREARFLARGKKYLDQKDYARATLEFRDANQANPRDAEPWYQLGIAYLAAKQPENAYVAFLKATELNPNHSSAQIKVSEMMVQSQQPEVLEEAVKRLNQVMTAPNQPEVEPEVLDTLAIADLKLKKPDEAVDLLQKALSKFPNDLKSAGALAAIQFGQHNVGDAERTLKKAVAQAPQSAQAALALANLYLLENKKLEAEPELQRAIKLDPNNAPALLSLGSLQLQSGRVADADETYRKIAAIPGANLSHIHAAFLFQQGKKAEAVEELEKLAKAPKADRAARLRLVGAYTITGRADDALRYLGALLQTDPKDVDALLLRSRVHLTTGKTAEAEKDLQAVLRLQPDSADAHYGLSKVQALLGSEKNRQEELNEALRLNPNILQPRVELARSEIAGGKAQAALDLMDAAPKVLKTGAAFVTTRNWALLTLNRVDEASAEVEKALHVERAPELTLQKGIVKFLKKDFAGARSIGQELMRDNPADPGALNLAMQACLADKQNPLALQILKEASTKNSTSPGMQLLIGDWLQRVGKTTEARAAFITSKTLNPRITDADLALAALDAQEGKVAAARSELAALLAAQPKNEGANLMLAEIEYAGKNTSAAAVHFNAVVEQNPDNVVALNAAAYLMAGQDMNTALKYAQHAAELAPGNPMVQDTLGWVYYRRGDYHKAVEFLAPSVAKQPSPVRQFHLAMAYFKTGERDLGQQYLSKALAQDPNLFKTEEGWLQ
ncbi:MAG TPA: tetratricopeptide repeat protein [Bryobacteraceae bacterium]|jgi:tetratricopeptide (TPR) repeat protein